MAAETTAAAVEVKEPAADNKREIKIITVEEKPVRPFRRIVDLLVGGVLLIMPICGFGAYIYFTLPVCGFGLLFLIGQKLLNRREPRNARLVVSMIIRVLAVIILVLIIMILANWGSSKKSLYKFKTQLYMIGNFGKTVKGLDFLPDKLPDTCKGFEMDFVSKKWKSNEHGSVRIRFITDKEGREQLKNTVEKLNAKVCSEGDFVYTKLSAYCDSIGAKMSGAEIFSVGEQKNHSPAFLINSRTGLCIIYW